MNHAGYYTPIGGPNQPGYFQNLANNVQARLAGWMPGNAVDQHANKIQELTDRGLELQNMISERTIAQENLRREMELAVLDHEKGLRAHLSLYTRGKFLDTHYDAYIVRLAEAYFERVRLINPIHKLHVFDHVLPLHYDDNLRREPFLMRDENTTDRANFRNKLQAGERLTYPWWKFGGSHVQKLIDPTGNEQSPYFVPERPNFWKYGLIISGVVTTVLVGRSIISHLCSSQMTGTIIQSAAKQQLLPTSTGISQNVYQNILPILSQVFTDISSVTYTILESGPFKSMWTACGQVLSEQSIKEPLMILGYLGK